MVSIAFFVASGVLAALAIRQEFWTKDYTRAILDVLWAGLLLAVGLILLG